jgi:hypothetical protein
VRIAPRQLWRVEGTVDRLTFAASGLVAFLIKFGVDWTIANLFGQPWRLINYWHLAGAHIGTIELVVLLTAALPFIWFGVTMCLLRSRDAGVTPVLCVLFFVPVLNLFYFAALCLLPPRPLKQRVETADSTGAVQSAIYAVLITTIIALPCVALSTFAFRQYGAMLFVGLPFCIGFIASILHGWRYPRSAGQSIIVSMISLTFVAGALLAVAWEGILCLAMAAPIAIPLTLGGAALGTVVQRSRRVPSGAMLCVPALLPLMLAVPVFDPVREVSSSIVINAPPERVWNNVVGFSEITAPPDLVFRAGIAYPLRATIAGRIRYCMFTTGAFVEPIEVWDAPRRLAFGVRSSPPPLEEMSPYNIRPPHLDGYFVSTHGQFLLERLPSGGTRLTGTTWYRNRLAPAAYWGLWSDAIIHRIHMRVLRHIRALSEKA